MDLPFRVEPDLGDEEPSSAGDRLGVNLAAAGDDDFTRAHCPGALRGEIERGLELMGHQDARRREAGVAGDDDRLAPGQRAADGEIGLASHHHRLAPGQRLEPLQIAGKPPGEPLVCADDAIARDGRDQDERRVRHTATLALIAGHGS